MSAHRLSLQYLSLLITLANPRPNIHAISDVSPNFAWYVNDLQAFCMTPHLPSLP
jgi:hypothetical protein